MKSSLCRFTRTELCNYLTMGHNLEEHSIGMLENLSFYLYFVKTNLLGYSNGMLKRPELIMGHNTHGVFTWNARKK